MSPDAPTDPPAAPAGVKSRAIGCLIVVGGVALFALIPVLGVMSKKLFVALLSFGVVGLMMGAGMILVPWTDEMFALNDQDDLGKFYRAMSRFWKVWFVLSLGVMVAVMFAALILT
jgi:hypothetical protein